MIIVYTHVTADILHCGHLQYLRSAKLLGDKLIVGVATDEALIEIKPRLIMPFRERLAIVSSLKFVDLAIPQKEYAPYKNVSNVGADILVESESHDEGMLAEGRLLMAKLGGRMVILPYHDEQSSTRIKEKIKNG